MSIKASRVADMSADVPERGGDPALDRALAAAAAAAPQLAAAAPTETAAILLAIGGALDAASDELVALGASETGLTVARLRGELRRTTTQLRLFSEVVREGSHLGVRIDEEDADFTLGMRPDLRRMLVPVGPVLVFAAGNFPFAFSVVGGDTAAALAAGCPVIVKAHESHPELSRRTATIADAALARVGAPEGTLALIEGRESGVDALRDPRIAAAAFTGSTAVGSLLARVAASRPSPIPFYGELGSVNPVFVTRAAAAARLEDIVTGFVASVSGSAGQLCTKPGFLFVPRATSLDERARAGVQEIAEHRMLSPGIGAAFAERRAQVLAAPDVRVVAEGAVRADGDQQWVTPTIVRTDLDALRAAAGELLEESFGPLAVVVDYDEPGELSALVADLFPGNLTASIHAAEGEDIGEYADLLEELVRRSGRVIFDGWPTGVAVAPAMTHGGPYPATVGGGTSVGTAAIERFLRPVTYQNAPEAVLPPALRDANPWQVPQARSTRDSSAGRGSGRRTR